MKSAETSADARFNIFVCGMKLERCSSHDCSRFATTACAFAVRRDGVATTCGRPVCERCVVLVGGKAHCAAHGRVASAKAGKS